jgi:small GTP-binding protein
MTLNLSINTLDGRLDVLRQNAINLITDMAGTLAELGDAARDDHRRLMDVAQDLREMFYLVVVIGEFNAGKSTFVNALLGDDLLPSGITPTTEAIELVRYNDTPRRAPTLRGDSIREWAHPNTGAAGVAIVDTPGTGSVFQRHETTAKEFLHRSDLVVFLISAKRAFAQTERLYLELAKGYGKKIILVVNQIDLLDPGEQDQVKRFIQQQVKELLDFEPPIFMLSAKQALTAAKTGVDSSASGLDAVRAHLRGVFSESPLAQQKLISQLDMVNSIAKKYYARAVERNSTVSTDTARVREIQRELQSQSMGLNQQLRDARSEVEEVFKGLRDRGLAFIENNLQVSLFKRPPSKEVLQKEFQDVVIGRALRDVNEATTGYVNAVIDHSRQYWRSVIDRLNQLQDVLENELGGLDAGVYAQQRESLQEAIKVAERELKSYTSGDVIAQIQQDFVENLGGFKTSLLAAAGGLVAILIAIAAPGPLVGVAGGIAAVPWALPLAIAGMPIALVGGGAAVRYYRKVKANVTREFNSRVDKLAAAYFEALDGLTRKEQDRLTKYGTQVLTPIFSRLDALLQQTNAQSGALQTYLDRADALRRTVTTEELKAAE